MEFLVEVHGEATELLAQRHGHGVLELGAAHLEDLAELLGLVVAGLPQRDERRFEPLERVPQGDAEARRVGVVGRLGPVDVVVGADDVVRALGMPEPLEREVGHHLVGVHVDRGAGAALVHAGRELVHAAPVDEDLVARPDDRVRHRLVQDAHLEVGQGGGLLHHDHAAHEVGDVADGGGCDGEVLDGSDRVDAVVRVRRDLLGAEQVFFHTGPGHSSSASRVASGPP